MVAARARSVYEAEAKERQKEQAKRNQPQSQKVENFPPLEKHKSRDAAGKALRVSGKSVDAAFLKIDLTRCPRSHANRPA